MSSSPRVLCIVLAGGQGSRLGPLTVGRAKPSLPVGGHYRLIDIALSNAAHSGLGHVWVLQQYEPHLLDEHLAGGRPWDLDRTRGGFRTLPPYQGQDQDGFAQGNASALLQNWPVIEALDPDVLVVCSADHLFRLDHRPVITEHLESGNEATIVTTTVPRAADAARALVVRSDGGRVTAVDNKPDEPAGREVGTEVFLYSPAALAEHLSALTAAGGELGDYGDRLIPSMVDGGRVGAVRHQGYWRDLGTPESYLDGQLDLLRDRPALRLDDEDWPMLTSMPIRSPARVRSGAELERAWLSPGADVAGSVVNSILGPGVRVEAGAHVQDSVLMHDVVIRAGARVERSVVAENASVGRDARVGSNTADEPVPVLIGARRRVAAGAVLEPGATLDPTSPRSALHAAR
ncbi:NTP transferase domain-containing protein [Nakamurella flavida]|uniref:NTP transferase domain-containing protein n=1 Tax=Nakamurella flavida TaxID=363630 RepID=A0A938YG01_9ACTN|nr:sugar phosphate nucleotidyltransferase [Nakamurella flavida]MBM9475207.1 NTP transferase domain-containing protein [Nakamurella flavida]MDP9776780.1 glucose-1-phosphate adenylyltransferase [Nakamurella flavida]